VSSVLFKPKKKRVGIGITMTLTPSDVIFHVGDYSSYSCDVLHSIKLADPKALSMEDIREGIKKCIMMVTGGITNKEAGLLQMRLSWSKKIPVDKAPSV